MDLRIVIVQCILNVLMEGLWHVSAVERFIEEMGLISQEGGDARIAGRIFGLLVVEGRELSLHQISERLGVSRASVSTNARRLAHRGVVRLTAHAGDRQDYYVLNNFPNVDMLGDLADRLIRNARDIQACVEPMRAENEAAARRVDDLSDAFEQSAQILQDWVIALRNGDKTFRKDHQ